MNISCIILDFTTTWLCKEKIGMNKYLANAFGVILGTFSFIKLNYTKVTIAPAAAFCIIILLFNSIILFVLHSNKRFLFYTAKSLILAATLIVYIMLLSSQIFS